MSDVCGLSASVDVFICRFVRINRTNACELNVHRSALQVAAETIAQYGAEDAVARLVALSLGYASKIPRVRPLSAPPLLRAHVRNTCAPASPPTEVNGSHACHAAPTLCWLAFEAEPHRPLVVDACQRVRYPAHRSPCFPCLQSVSVISGRTGFKCVTVRVEPGIGSIRNGTSPVAVIKALETLYVCPTLTMLPVLKSVPLCATHTLSLNCR
jgi:hypothetical protein